MILISFSGNGWDLLHVIFLFSQVDHLKYWAAGGHGSRSKLYLNWFGPIGFAKFDRSMTSSRRYATRRNLAVLP
jgi:hypothetical protein